MSPFFLIGYAALTALGIAAVAWVLNKTRLSQEAQITPADARRAAEAASQAPLTDTPPITAGRTFLFKTEDGFVAVRPQGARIHARAIAPQEIKAVKVVKDGVKIVLEDYADPVLVVRTEDVEGLRGFLAGDRLSGREAKASISPTKGQY